MENTKKDKPNVIYMVFDDTGYSDFGCYGSEISTPNIDYLAQNGLRYNHFNVTPLCSPTRAALLTGRNPHSVGLGYIAETDLGPDFPHTRGRITEKATTLAEILKDEGFSTYSVGKWHLTPPKETSAIGPFQNWPLGRGFERFYGFLKGATDQYTPDLVQDNHRIEQPDKDKYHLTEDLIDHSIQYLTDHVSVQPDNPYFLYLAFGAQHEPHQVFKEYVEQYEGVYDVGWDEIRKKRFMRQKELGIIPEDAELAPRNPGVEKWTDLPIKEKKLFARLQEVYAGFLSHTDEQIGRLLQFLRNTNQLDNTIIVLLADNGANHQGMHKGASNSMVFFNNLGEQDVDDMLSKIDDLGKEGTEPNYPLGWAQVGNTPFKYYKGHTHHGGIRVPFIMHWPNGITDKSGIREQYHYVIDVTPTILDILDIDAPEEYEGVKQMPMQGVSMKYTINNPKEKTKRNKQYYLMSGNRGIWHNGWKAVTLHKRGTPFEDDQWELYHIEKDFSGIYNLADSKPEKLDELIKLWWKKADKYGALPLIEGGITTFTKEERNKFVFYPGISHIPMNAAPNVIDKSFMINIPIERKSKTDEGVLVSHGYHGSGYTLYIKDEKVVFEYNYVGEIFRLESTKLIPLGKSNICFQFDKTGSLQGKGTIFINEELAGQKNFSKTMPLLLSRVGLDIGRDRRGHVSPNYKEIREFPFSGEIEKVTITIDN